MDLDFSFALMSSLTPRCKNKTALAENNTKISAKSLKLVRNRPRTQRQKKVSEEKVKSEKENSTPPKQRLTKLDRSSGVDRVSDPMTNDSDQTRLEFPVDMANIAVRKPRSGKKVERIVISSDDDIVVSPELLEKPSSSSRKESNTTFKSDDKDKLNDSLSKSDIVLSDSPTYDWPLSGKRGVKRKSPILCSSEIPPFSSSSKVPNADKRVTPKENINEWEYLTNKYLKRRSFRSSEFGSSLSPAYDSDPVTVSKKAPKVIPETPESDENEGKLLSGIAAKSGANACPEGKSDNFKGLGAIMDFKGFGVINNFKGFDAFQGFGETDDGFSEANENPKKKLRSSRGKSLNNSVNSNKDVDFHLVPVVRKFPTPSDKPLLADTFKIKSAINDKRAISTNNKQIGKNTNKCNSDTTNSKTEALTEIKDSKKNKAVLDGKVKEPIAKIRSKQPTKQVTTKYYDYPESFTSEKSDDTNSKTEAPTEIKDSKKTKAVLDGKVKEPIAKIRSKQPIKQVSKYYDYPESFTSEKSTDINIRRKSDRSTRRSSGSDKIKLVPPTEVIPKLEHINNWLKSSQENAAISVSQDPPFGTPNEGQLVPNLKKIQVTLSPRIKRKKKVAQSSLEDEQKLFKELYGEDLAKRLSDEVDKNKEEILSIASSRDSLQSEKMLEELYENMLQKNTVVPKTEPRKGRKKVTGKKHSPRTEKKKQRTSIYEVFSSSSSEDRFEEFLESVKRGKLKSRRSRSNRPRTPDFIRDSDSESDASPCFYQNILASAVKEDLDKLSNTDHKMNGRRLSFGSSKDTYSESGRVETKPKKKEKKSTKDRKKHRTKNTEKDGEQPKEMEGFTLVTPIKIKDKKTDLSERIRAAIEPVVPSSIGKSKTLKAPPKAKDDFTEDRLRAKYLNGDFKVPASNNLKTPSKPISRDVPPSPCLSFLSSLSGVTAGLPCHPDALIYKKNFKKNREELTKKLFALYNREIFENQLPAEMLIQWNTRMTSTSGYCYNKRSYCKDQILRSSRIVLSTKILDRADRLRDTMIHELCHAATWIINAVSDGHGPKWRAWADKANQRFPELPVIKRCHDYAIETKYTYKCASCGYCIGRHSKSLDVDRKRCGYCYGVFQLFVTSKMATTPSGATSGTNSDSLHTQRPRPPNGFALFVKENYAAVKKENNVPHAQVMKLLGQKFAEVKIAKNTT